MSSLFDIGLSGVRASQYAMYLSANNIVNAPNVYYTTRQIDFYEQNSGLFGSGVDVGDVRRISNSLAEQQLLISKNNWARSSTLFNNLKNLETYIDKDDISIGKFINASMVALETLNASPTSAQGRNYYLDQLKNMSNRINDVGSYLNQESIQTRKSIEQQVNNTNQLLQQLAELNSRMKIATGSEKLSMQDNQDQLLNSLTELIDFNKQTDENGLVRIQLKNGTPLLQDTYIASLVVTNNANGDGAPDIGIQNSNGTTSITPYLNGGSIVGLLDYSKGSLSLLQHKLDKLSISMAHTINNQNKLGITAQGVLGGNIFNDFNTPEISQNRVMPSPLNAGAGVFDVQIDAPGLLVDSNYQLNFDSPSHYTLVRTSDGATMSDGALSSFPTSISVDGFSLNINNGTFMSGDTYTINPTKNGAIQLKIAAPNGSAIALGSPVTSSASLQNRGTGQINSGVVLDTSTSAFSTPGMLNPPIRVEFTSATTYRLLNSNDNTILEDNIPYNPLNTQQIFPTPGGYDPGYRMNLSGTIESGDSFSIDYNSNGSGDNRNGLIMETLYKTQVSGSTGLTFVQSYQDLVFALTASTSSVKNIQAADLLLKDQAQKARDEPSAVSLPDEILTFRRLQESYMANAKVLEAAKQTMDSIFALLRG